MSHFALNTITAPISSRYGMTHAVLQSIHNYAESTRNDRARTESDERGGAWSENYRDLIGSRDWTLKREKLTDQTLRLAKQFYTDALQWLLDEGYATSIEINVWKEDATTMAKIATITLKDGDKFEVTL